MFSWICPKCGREVPLSYTECPNCGPQSEQPASPSVEAAPPPSAAPSVPVTPVAATPPPPPRPVGAAPPAAPLPAAYAVRPHTGTSLPTWLLTLLFAFAFLGLGAGIYWSVGYFRGRSQAAAPSPTVESPAAKPGTQTNPLQKYIEISGVRFGEDAKKHIIVKFTLTNHSDADLSGLAGNVTIWGRTQKSEEDAVGTFPFTAKNAGPQSSQELTAPLTTKLKIYELPDWQNVTTDLQITAPAQ